MTMVVPWVRRRNEGSWKVRDFPDPVGRVARVFLPATTCSMISS